VKHLFVFAGVAQTRALLCLDGRPLSLFFAPSIGATDKVSSLEAGMVVGARITALATHLNGAFVDIGPFGQGFVPFKKTEKRPHEGALFAFDVSRPKMKDKSVVLSLRSEEKPLSSDVVPGKILRGGNPIELICHHLSQDLDEIFVDRIEALEKFNVATNAIVSNGIEYSVYLQLQDAIEQSLANSIVLLDGSRAIFDECEGATIIDVDSGAIDLASRRVSKRVNEAAVAEIFREVSLRSIAGRVVIDFLPPRSRENHDALEAVIKTQKYLLPTAKFGKLQHDGLFDMTLSKKRKSLLDVASEVVGSTQIRAGRRLTLDWIVHEVVFEVERRLTFSKSDIRLHLGVGRALYAFLNDIKSEVIQRLAARYPGRVNLTLDEKLEDLSYAIYE